MKIRVDAIVSKFQTNGVDGSKAEMDIESTAW
jgi:hypothetical protein